MSEPIYQPVVSAGDSSPLPYPSTTKVRHVGWWLLGLFAIALLIRLTYLAAKPAWMDEISTILFSLGNSSRLIPTDQIITLEQIIRPLSLTPGATAADSATYLLAENNHPPAYFVLAHWWMMFCHRLIGKTDGYASVWAARALPAFFGAIAVPVSYWLGWTSFRCRLTALLCAALMAVSPFSVFLSQEARHYTLAILMVMGSLGCFVLAARAIREQRAIGWLTVIGWIAVNALGVAVHYFCAITYFIEGLVLLYLLVRDCGQDRWAGLRSRWIRIYIVALGTAAGALLWLPTLLNFYGSPQTTYITGSRGIGFWLGPIAQSVAGGLYAILAPVSNGYGAVAVTTIVISCILLLFGYVPWFVRMGVRSLKFQWRQPDRHTGLLAVGGFFIMGNIVFLAICYGAGFDITRGHRYSFVFYPSIVILVGAMLAPFWTEGSHLFRQIKLPLVKRFISGRSFVLTVLGVSFLGSLVIVLDRTHLKFYQADRFVDFIQAESAYPVILGAQSIVGEQPSVYGIEIMSAAWEIQQQLKKDVAARSRWQREPRFLLLKKDLIANNDSEENLRDLVRSVSQPFDPPFDLWLLRISPSLESVGCSAPVRGNKGSFSHSHYICNGA
ncbi:phospholipid carrier-dependent glycosyltransferase [cf. Phormidesmis sp. LEGE 11477]|uniref:glycosyltransferase family 39 protein n=1 Tax=cf. Phormidesmis sp. LEGE 11477 TaxID=1828680 RepID=UPI00187F79C6|nr:phospholipid carrier-dependent glycosyltransferase [cf. Phormidesmis sp. LEGE 11477]MBE9063056.1 phospholipid carrier-dependent glycosyltransferase [cf. Phormidesmis sp. LEGE 11477]